MDVNVFSDKGYETSSDDKKCELLDKDKKKFSPIIILTPKPPCHERAHHSIRKRALPTLNKSWRAYVVLIFISPLLFVKCLSWTLNCQLNSSCALKQFKSIKFLLDAWLSVNMVKCLFSGIFCSAGRINQRLFSR